MIAAGAGNNHANSNNNFYYQRQQIICYCSNYISRRQSKAIKLLSKGFERSVYWNEQKTKRENKNTTKEYRYLLESSFRGVNRFFVLVHSNQDNNSKIFKTKRYHLLLLIIIMSSSMEKTTKHLIQI